MGRLVLYGPLAALVLILATTGCGTDEFDMPDPTEEPDLEDVPPLTAQIQDQFWINLQALCGQAFRGEVTRIQDVEADFTGDLVVHFRECDSNEIRMPLHVGENRSRTWIVSRVPEGLRLKHDHRREDGGEADVSRFGGETVELGTENRQEFYADDFTADLIPEAATNVWTLEIVPGESFVYALRREGTERRVRFEFDLNDPVDPPPAPWGHEGG